MDRDLVILYFLHFQHADNRKRISVNNSLCGKCIDVFAIILWLRYKLEKWFPLQGERAHSLYFLSFNKT